MLKRKIEKYLSNWKEEKGHKPLVIKGVRQCGKTFIVQKFAKENYKHVVYINFMKTPQLALAFVSSLEVDNITMLISSVIKDVEFAAGSTCIILDEIQECPQARTALKYFALDGRYDVIATGSLLGVKGYEQQGRNGKKEHSASIPVGYEDIVQMYPLDFEEFLWANGINGQVTETLRQCLESEEAVPALLHSRMEELLLHYTIVGGMPEVVNTFIETHNLSKVHCIQRRIIDEYEDDMMKYADASDKPNIRECFESIPKQLAKENKKFQYSVVKKNARATTYLGSLQWIEDAGIARRCYNLSTTSLPLDISAIDDCFKVYMCDTGLFVAMLEEGTSFDILQGNLNSYKGALYENIMADILGKMGRRLYYFQKKSGLEVDFVIRYKNACTILEVKAKGGKTKSSDTILRHPETYNVEQCIKFGKYNVGRPAPDSPILILPLYMAFLLNESENNDMII